MASEDFESCPIFPDATLLCDVTHWLSKNRKSTLAGLTYDKDIVLTYSCGIGYSLTTRNNPSNSVLIIGQLSEESTVGALGDHLEKWDGKPPKVYDGTKIFDILRLECPDDAPPLLEHIFRQQTAVLNQIRFANYENEVSDSRPVVVEEWLDPAQLKPMTTIKCYLGPKYVLPGLANAGANPLRIPRANFLDDLERQTCGDKWDENEPYCTPYCLPDYRGDLFAHQSAKLSQLDVRDSGNDPVHAARTYGFLRPGALVLIEARLSHQVISDTQQVKKFFRLYANKVRVLDVKQGSFFKLYKTDICKAVSGKWNDPDERYVVKRSELQKRKIMENYGHY